MPSICRGPPLIRHIDRIWSALAGKSLQSRRLRLSRFSKSLRGRIWLRNCECAAHESLHKQFLSAWEGEGHSPPSLPGMLSRQDLQRVLRHPCPLLQLRLLLHEGERLLSSACSHRLRRDGRDWIGFMADPLLCGRLAITSLDAGNHADSIDWLLHLVPSLCQDGVDDDRSLSAPADQGRL